MILMYDGLKDAESPKSVLREVSLILRSIYRSKPPQATFWGREGAFSSQTGANMKSL